MPKGIMRNPAAVAGIDEPLSICAMLALCTSAADFFETILMAAACPVMACLASLTLPVAPLPKVLPSCHGPTCVFRLDFADVVEVVEIAELRFELLCPSFARAERRLLSAAACAGAGGTRLFLML
jgi:hypothetical protein